MYASADVVVSLIMWLRPTNAHCHEEPQQMRARRNDVVLRTALLLVGPIPSAGLVQSLRPCYYSAKTLVRIGWRRT